MTIGDNNGHMPVYREQAVVLRTQRLGEADRIVTLLTRDRGRIRAVAKGVRRTTSRFGARLEPFGHVDLMLNERAVATWQPGGGRGLDTVTQAESLRSYGDALSTDYPRWTSAHAIVEAAGRLTPEEGEPAPVLYRLLLGALGALVAEQHAPSLVLDSFLLRSLAVAGWAPSFTECVLCGKPGPHQSIAVALGGAVCAEHKVPGAASVTPGTVVLLGALLSGEWIVADVSEDRARREASGVVARHLSWHLERGLRSLPLVERA